MPHGPDSPTPVPLPPADAPPPPPHPHEARIGSLEGRVDNHDRQLVNLTALVQQNEVVSQQSRLELTNTVRNLSDNFAKMESEQKEMPGLVRDLHEAIVGTAKEAGIAEDVRGLKARQRSRGRTWDAVLGAILTLGAMLGASLLYLLIAGHAAKP